MPRRAEPIPHSYRKRPAFLELVTLLAVSLLILLCVFSAKFLIEGQGWFTRDADWQRGRALNHQEAERLRQERERIQSEHVQPTYTLIPTYTPKAAPGEP